MVWCRVHEAPGSNPGSCNSNVFGQISDKIIARDWIIAQSEIAVLTITLCDLGPIVGAVVVPLSTSLEVWACRMKECSSHLYYYC